MRWRARRYELGRGVEGLDGGLVVDLSRMRTVEVDADGRRDLRAPT
jgi:hypothetical protein